MWKAFKIERQIQISELFSAFEAYREYNYSFSGEVHDFWECVYIIDGDVLVSGDERIYNLKADDMIFHKPMELHKYNITSPKGGKLLIFSFNATGEALNRLKNKVCTLKDREKADMSELLNFLHEQNNTNVTIPEEQLYLKASDDSQMYLNYLVLKIEQIILSVSQENTNNKISYSPDAVIFNKAVSYMTDNLHIQLTISDIAKKCNISQTSLKNIFVKYAGLSVHSYFLTLKISKAKEYLQNRISVSEISDLLGFSSQGYFSHAFKRETGISPSDYLK